MSFQGYLNPTIKNFHHVTFLIEVDSFFINSLKNSKNCARTEDHKADADWSPPYLSDKQLQW